MSRSALSLWPDAIRPVVRSPRSILSEQADELTKQTAGTLVGELTVKRVEGHKIQLALDVFVPTLDYRHRVLVAVHHATLVYPVTIEAEIFEKSHVDMMVPAGSAWQKPRPKAANEASNDDELVELVKRVVTSPQVVASAVALIARAQEVVEERERSAEDSGTALAKNAEGVNPPPTEQKNRSNHKGEGESGQNGSV